MPLPHTGQLGAYLVSADVHITCGNALQWVLIAFVYRQRCPLLSPLRGEGWIQWMGSSWQISQILESKRKAELTMGSSAGTHTWESSTFVSTASDASTCWKHHTHTHI